MAHLKVFDVIWIHDDCIRPPGPKMVVCINSEKGFFFRINTEGKWQNPVKLLKTANEFLEHDSFLECGEPLELDDYVVESSLDGKGIIGRIDTSLANDIFKIVNAASTISNADKELIRRGMRDVIAPPAKAEED